MNDRPFVRIAICNIQIRMVRLEDDVSYAVRRDGIRLPVGHLRLGFQKFRAERPVDDFLGRFLVEETEKLFTQLAANFLYGGRRIGSRHGAGSRFVFFLRSTAIGQHLVALDVGSRYPESLARRPTDGRRVGFDVNRGILASYLLCGQFLLAVHLRWVEIVHAVLLADVLDGTIFELTIHENEFDIDHLGGVFEQLVDDLVASHSFHDWY